LQLLGYGLAAVDGVVDRLLELIPGAAERGAGDALDFLGGVHDRVKILLDAVDSGLYAILARIGGGIGESREGTLKVLEVGVEGLLGLFRCGAAAAAARDPDDCDSDSHEQDHHDRDSLLHVRSLLTSSAAPGGGPYMDRLSQSISSQRGATLYAGISWRFAGQPGVLTVYTLNIYKSVIVRGASIRRVRNVGQVHHPGASPV
jgi:hypothetical protein